MLAAIFLFLALRGLDWAAFLASVRSANYSYLPVVFLWGSITSFIRSMRWRILLTTNQPIPVRNVFWANMAGYLGNNILPSRAGELIRAMYVAQENKIPASFSLATGLAERFIDLLALIVLGSLALSYTGITSATIQSALRVVSWIALAGVLALLIAPFFGRKLMKWIATFPILQRSVGIKTVHFFEQFLEGIKALHDFKRLALLILSTTVIWLMDAIGVVLVARSIHLDFLLLQAFVLLSGLGLSSAIPSTPGYVGVYQYVTVLVLEPFGIPKSSALAFIIILQVVNFLTVAFWGGIAVTRASSFSQR